MWKLLFNFKVLIAMALLWFVGRLFFRKKTKPTKVSESDMEQRIYKNVTKAIINGYNQARRDEDEEQKHRGITDDSYQ
tara:strand:- start:1301 stop:1534 length:234 start_codon:yes stop_codon:yes gene_type:complete